MKKVGLLLVFLVSCAPTEKSWEKYHKEKYVKSNRKAVVRLSTEESNGTGFVVQSKYIVTAGHLVDSMDQKIKVRYHDCDRSIAEPIVRGFYDYAVLTTEVPDDVPELDLVYQYYPSVSYLYNTYSYYSSDRSRDIAGGITYGVAITENSIVTAHRYIMYSRKTYPGASGSPLIKSGTDDVYGILVEKGGKGHAFFIPSSVVNERTRFLLQVNE